MIYLPLQEVIQPVLAHNQSPAETEFLPPSRLSSPNHRIPSQRDGKRDTGDFLLHASSGGREERVLDVLDQEIEYGLP